MRKDVSAIRLLLTLVAAFWQSPIHGARVHTCRPGPLSAPCPETLASLLNKTFRRPCSVSGVLEAVAGTAQAIIRPEIWHAELAKPFVKNPKLPVQWAKLQDALLCLAAERTGQLLPAPCITPVKTDSIRVLSWMPLLGLGPGVACSGKFAVSLWTIPACY
eukprot:1158828-Pelagomonas_calceolata.AAC.3